FAVELNTTSGAVKYNFNVGGTGQLVDIDFASGPLTRLELTGVDICFGTALTSCTGVAPSLHGNFFFDRSTKNGFGTSGPIQPGGTDTSQALAVGDVNNDGTPDLVVGNNGPNKLYLNNGSGVFVPASSDLFDGGADNTTSLALVDVNGDNFLDL